MANRLDELYGFYDELVEAEKEGKLLEKTSVYEKIISRALTGDSKEKRLVSQFIAKFFKHFPELEIRAVEAQIELCDDADINVRKQAIHDLPSFCARGHDDPYISRIAIVLCQLLIVEEKGELAIVEKSLNTLLRQSVHATVKGVFGQMTSSVCDDSMRDACIRFLCSKVNLKVLEKETEQMMLEEAVKVATLLGGEEFVLLLKLLSALKISKLVVNQQVILKMIADQLQLSSNPAFDAEHIVKLKTCLPLAIPFFTPFTPSQPYVTHLVDGFLPKMDVQSPDSLDLLKILAQISPHYRHLTDEDNADLKLEFESVLKSLFERIQEFLPQVPADDDLEKDPELPSLHLSHLECLLLAFNNIARKVDPAFTKDEALLKSIRQRLQYLNRGLQGEAKKLRGLISQGVKIDADKRAAMQLALKTIANLTAFIKDWFHNPPAFKTTVAPSWLQNESAKKPSASAQANGSNQENKRKAIVFENNDAPAKKFGRDSRKLYEPPKGNSGRGRFRSGRW
ncbi:apoptosis inhibitor 5 [Galendromus occidentalis]|uniref:Apoptosis inhibitor 5 n=1 Tax=Galendromus occidentalis TaxID=34638 RepID=A0AAJ6VZF7_9ACAR|nr:apoptosis inhibitor 5 [Galendromus occidentalis]